jgi:hypothetical protein
MNKAILVISAAFALVIGASCSTDDATLNRSCSVSSDCVVVNNCCDGCSAANRVSYTPTDCGETCIIDPCTGEHPNAAVSAVCSAGTCELVVDGGSGGAGGASGGAGGT